MKNKGFTLVEMLTVLVILGLLIGIGVFTVNNIRDNAEKNYYVSMEDTLKIAGNDYFNDNREDRPIDDYNFVSLETLEDHEYLDALKTYDKKEDCDKSSGVYIYNTEDGNAYEVCLKCGIHKSTGPYCSGKKTGQIMITGKTNTGGFYNPTLSYVGTPWSNASYINVTFKLMGDDVSTNKFEIYNGNTNALDSTCTSISANSCTSRMSVTGSYYVIAYNGSEKVGNRKYFNIKIDNTPPTFDIKDQEQEKDLGDGFEFPYNNEVINIHDDNGYKSAVFSLKELVDTNPSVDIVNKDLTASNLQILENLPSGKYRLTVTVTDYARNSTTKSIEFANKYNVDMVYFDNTEKKHDIGIISVYKGGKYDNLSNEIKVGTKTYIVDWYDNTNFTGIVYDSNSSVTNSSVHSLYGREKRMKILESDNPVCNNGGDITYNGEDQILVSAKTGYSVSNNVKKEAGTYTIVAMPDDNYTWSDNTRTYKLINCTIKPYRVEFNPTVNPCKQNLVYNASTQQLVNLTGHEAHIGDSQVAYRLQWNSYDIYTITPYVKKDAGSYNVKYHLLSSNFVWADGTAADKSYTCKIGRYPVEFPGECELTYGGLNNEGGHNVGKGVEPFPSEWRSIRATGKNIKSGNDMVYEAEVSFGDLDLPFSSFKLSNYYISKPLIDCAIIKAPTTIVADSDSKRYDGKALTNDGYKEKNGVTSALGDTISSVTITGSQTEVGSSDNVPSNTVIKHGGKDVTKYYSIQYENGTLEVKRSKTATEGSCNSNATANGSDKIVTGGSHVNYTNNTTTSAGNKTVTITPQSNYAWSDGTYGSKTKTCYVKEPCTWKWVEVSTDWNVSNCRDSYTTTVKKICSNYTGSPYSSVLKIQCQTGGVFNGGTYTNDKKGDAKKACDNAKTPICSSRCGGPYVNQCYCTNESGTEKTKRVTYNYKCV
jgi:prepilin-type N-terminal cleavage/methylation domain-containing protein